MRSREPSSGERDVTPGQGLGHVAGDDAVRRRRARPPATPARACRRTPAQAAANGSMPLASSAPRTPPSTSPVPGGGERRASRRGLTPTRPSGSATIVSSPLSTTIAPRALRRLARVAQPRRLDRVAVDVRAAARARPRAASGRSARGASRSDSEPAGVGVEAVGVEDERHLRAAAALARELLRAPSSRPSPGPRTSAPPRAGASITASAPCGDVRAVAVGQRARHHLEQLDREDRLLGAPATQRGHVAGARAHRGRRRPGTARRSARASRPRRARGRR